jgi:hypothetical protein
MDSWWTPELDWQKQACQHRQAVEFALLKLATKRWQPVNPLINKKLLHYFTNFKSAIFINNCLINSLD